MCHTVVVNVLIDHRIRRSWTAEAADAAQLPARAARWLEQRIGPVAPGAAAAAGMSVEIPSPKLDESAVAALSKVVGAENVLVDDTASPLLRATVLGVGTSAGFALVHDIAGWEEAGESATPEAQIDCSTVVRKPNPSVTSELRPCFSVAASPAEDTVVDSSHSRALPEPRRPAEFPGATS